MPVGTVTWSNAAKGCGFIGLSDGSKDVFVHPSLLAKCGLTALMQGQRLRYELVQGPNGSTLVENLRPV
ncbi:MAG: cold-shock protein [Betaproteobacteria bacterium]|nr:cold-shock protein [Betaproteobacteria bacterium]